MQTNPNPETQTMNRSTIALVALLSVGIAPTVKAGSTPTFYPSSATPTIQKTNIKLAQPNFKIVSVQVNCTTPSSKVVFISLQNTGMGTGPATVTMKRQIAPGSFPEAPIVKQSTVASSGKQATVSFSVPVQFLGADISVTPGTTDINSHINADTNACIF